MRRRFAILAGRARQPGVGTLGVIGTITAVLLAVAVWAVPSTARRAQIERPAPLFTLPAPPLQPAPAPVRLTITAPEVVRGATAGAVSAVASPAAPGRTVVFEERIGGRWRALGSARENAAGRAVARLSPRSFGPVELRAVIAGVAESATVTVAHLRPNARVYTWREWIESPAWDRDAFVAEVSRILADPRGWAATGEAFFRHVDSGTPRMWVRLATPRTTDRLCAPTRTRGIWNCRAGRSVVVNSNRWFSGRSTWPGPLAEYRALIINHETGHLLGFGHSGCSAAGRAAPVMQQQGVSLGGCRPNGWPVPGELARL